MKAKMTVELTINGENIAQHFELDYNTRNVGSFRDTILDSFTTRIWQLVEDAFSEYEDKTKPKLIATPVDPTLDPPVESAMATEAEIISEENEEPDEQEAKVNEDTEHATTTDNTRAKMQE